MSSLFNEGFARNVKFECYRLSKGLRKAWIPTSLKIDFQGGESKPNFDIRDSKISENFNSLVAMELKKKSEGKLIEISIIFQEGINYSFLIGTSKKGAGKKLILGWDIDDLDQFYIFYDSLTDDNKSIINKSGSNSGMALASREESIRQSAAVSESWQRWHQRQKQRREEAAAPSPNHHHCSTITHPVSFRK